MKICHFILILFWCALYIPGRSTAIQDENFVNKSSVEDSSDIPTENVEINVIDMLPSDFTTESVQEYPIDMLMMRREKSTLTARNCLDLKKQNRNSGTYLIKPCDMSNKLVKVYCDMDTDGGGWTMIQRRYDYEGQEDFYNTWYEYAMGFGDVSKDFWLGNDNIHCLTEQSHQEIRFDLADFDGNIRYANYGFFHIADRSNQYKLRAEGYSGDAGDSLAWSNNMKFSTHDADYDTWGDNCADVFKGAWWYSQCHHSNLNGLYLRGPHTTFANGVNWYHFKGYNYSLKKSEMKIREKN